MYNIKEFTLEVFNTKKSDTAIHYYAKCQNTFL